MEIVSQMFEHERCLLLIHFVNIIFIFQQNFLSKFFVFFLSRSMLSHVLNEIPRFVLVLSKLSLDNFLQRKMQFLPFKNTLQYKVFSHKFNYAFWRPVATLFIISFLLTSALVRMHSTFFDIFT